MQSVIDRPPPTTVGHHGGGDGERWVQLFRARNDIEAHLLAGRMAGSGIEIRAIKDRSSAVAWMHNGSDPSTPVDLWVRRMQLDEAKLVLAEIAFDQPARRPEESERTDWKIPVMWWAAAITLALTFTGIALSNTADYLRRCGLSTECEPATSTP